MAIYLGMTVTSQLFANYFFPKPLNFNEIGFALAPGRVYHAFPSPGSEGRSVNTGQLFTFDREAINPEPAEG